MPARLLKFGKWQKTCHRNLASGVFVLETIICSEKQGGLWPLSRQLDSIDKAAYHTSTGNLPVQLKIADRPGRDRIQRLVNLAYSLLREAETLARDKAFTDESSRLQTLDPANGVDFYREVEQFETGLIKLALDHTGGNQSRAAKM